MMKKLLPLAMLENAEADVRPREAKPKSVRLDGNFVELTETHAEVSMRSVPKQIEHWAQIGRIVEENPDLPYEFIRESLLATAEIQSGLVKKYVRRKSRVK